MTTYRAKVQWIQSTDLFIDATGEEDANKQFAELLKQSTVIWNSDWKTDIVRVESVGMDMSKIDSILDDIISGCDCDNCDCTDVEVTE